MPLITSEDAAVQVLAYEIESRGSSFGANNYARTVLGAHAEQASRLVKAANLKLSGGDYQSVLKELDDDSVVQITQEINGKEMNLTLKADALPITSFEELVAFYEIDTDVWEPASQLFNFWGSKDNPNFQVKASFKKNSYVETSKADREDFINWAKTFSPEFVGTPVATTDSPRLLEIMVADLHAGKLNLGEDQLNAQLYDMMRAVVHIYQQATANGMVGEVLLVLCGDTFNDEGSRRTTSAGTPQETSNNWRKVFQKVRERLAELTLLIGETHPVTLLIIPGNHDEDQSFYLQDSLSGYFDNHPNVTVPFLAQNRWYKRWGRVLLGFTHGDSIKPADLPMLMMREADAAGADVLEWHLGHLHTKLMDEIQGVLIRRFRSPARPDFWHDKRGYSLNGRDITGIVWHEDRGEEASYTKSFFQGA